jgi:23S rRNA-/tRNA-specific pseudouridylate synthase
MTHTYTVPEGIRRLRADKALALAFPDHSRTAIQRAFDSGLVTLRGAAIKRDQGVAGGDTLEFAMPETKPAELRAVDIPLDVVFEDKHLLAVNKASGMVVHPGAATGEDTLVHALLSHCAGSLSGIGGVERPGIVHRLDRETTGIIIVAKNDKAHRGLAEQFSERTLHKEYLALVAGAPGLLSGSVKKAIGRNQQHRHKMTVIDKETAGRARDAREGRAHGLGGGRVVWKNRDAHALRDPHGAHAPDPRAHEIARTRGVGRCGVWLEAGRASEATACARDAARGASRGNASDHAQDARSARAAAEGFCGADRAVAQAHQGRGEGEAPRRDAGKAAQETGPAAGARARVAVVRRGAGASAGRLRPSSRRGR